MLISEFSRKVSLSRETVRFYVRCGLFQPMTTQKGGRNPYQLFREEDVRAAELVRIGQALGLSLKEIAELMEKRRKGKLPRERRIAMMKDQLAKLEIKARELRILQLYVRAKIAWQEGGEQGSEPTLNLRA